MLACMLFIKCQINAGVRLLVQNRQMIEYIQRMIVIGILASVAALRNSSLEESPGADGGCLRFHFSVFQKLSRSGSPLGLAKITHRQK